MTDIGKQTHDAIDIGKQTHDALVDARASQSQAGRPRGIGAIPYRLAQRRRSPERHRAMSGRTSATILTAMLCFTHKTKHGLYQFINIYGKKESNLVRLLRFKHRINKPKERPPSPKRSLLGIDRQKFIYIQNCIGCDIYRMKTKRALADARASQSQAGRPAEDYPHPVRGLKHMEFDSTLGYPGEGPDIRILSANIQGAQTKPMKYIGLIDYALRHDNKYDIICI